MALHPSELAEVTRSASWNRDLAIPVVAPNTSHEWEALQALDRLRREELHEQSTRGRRPTVRI